MSLFIFHLVGSKYVCLPPIKFLIQGFLEEENICDQVIFEGEDLKKVLEKFEGWLYRRFDSMVVEKMKNTIMDKSTKYQIEGYTKHRPQGTCLQKRA